MLLGGGAGIGLAAADLGATQTAQFDAADETALQQFFQQLDGPIGHVLVSAGGPYYAPFAELDVADAMRYVSRSLAPEVAPVRST